MPRSQSDPCFLNVKFPPLTSQDEEMTESTRGVSNDENFEQGGAGVVGNSKGVNFEENS